MKILLVSDEKTPLVDVIEQWLVQRGHVVIKEGHLLDENQKWHWAEIGKDVGFRVANKEYDAGIVCCWSGTGVSIAANRIPGARVALCGDSETARLARKWDNANILALS